MTFEAFQKIFFAVVAAFIVFVVIKILLTRRRWQHESETRRQLAETRRAQASGPTSTDAALHSTFGFSGQSASDSTPAGSLGSGDFASGDTGGGDSGGGGWND